MVLKGEKATTKTKSYNGKLNNLVFQEKLAWILLLLQIFQLSNVAPVLQCLLIIIKATSANRKDSQGL